MAKRSHRLKIVINVVTLALIGVVIYFAWPDIVAAWELLSQVNIWILLLLIPVQVFSYFAKGMTIFSYLKGRGQLRRVRTPAAAEMSLELNFVNHIFPSGGVSGVTYMIWRLGKLRVSAGQATMAQLVQAVMTGAAFVVCLAVSLGVVTAGNTADNWIVMLSAVTVTGVIFILLFAGYLIGSRNRMVSFAKWVSRSCNKFVRIATFGHKKKVLPEEKATQFFVDIHGDFEAVKAEKKLLIRPLIWSFLFVVADVGLFAVAFWALGTPFNPAMLVIGYGAASVVGAIMITPGGAGGFEVTMITVLAAGGMAAADASAGIILARVILILGTLATGYVVYHRAMRHFGKPRMDTEIKLAPEEIK